MTLSDYEMMTERIDEAWYKAEEAKNSNDWYTAGIYEDKAIALMTARDGIEYDEYGFEIR